MVMNEIILNEKSLQGQYTSMDEFADSIPQFLKCVGYFMKREDWQIWKRSDLFQAPVTKREAFFNIRGNCSDAVRRMKGFLCQMSDEPPYWDLEPRQCGNYLEGEKDVTGTSLAEASARTGVVLSFPKSSYEDKEIELLHDGKKERIDSFTSVRYSTCSLYKNGYLSIEEYLKEHYHGTRLCFDEFDFTYGFAEFEKDEIEECLESFERFIGHENWTEIIKDPSLRYKEYRASEKENWFKNSKYKDTTIHKFRCGNPKRCFGYRKDDIFYALRMERDHSISDNG